jgi:hypothetical protein
VVLQGGFSFGMSHTTVACVVAGAAAGWLVGLILSGHPLRDELANGMKLLGRRLRRSAL